MSAGDRDREDMRRRWVGWHLEHILSIALLHRGRADAYEQMIVPHEAELRAYVAVGALTEHEARAWSERYVRAAEALAMPDDEACRAVRARAEQVLEERLAALEPGDRASRDGFRATLVALRHVGAISEETQDDFEARGEPPAPPRKPAARPFLASVLTRVVPGPEERLSAVRLICAELYRDCVMLRWHRLLTPAEATARDEPRGTRGGHAGPVAQRRRIGEAFELRDDAGTRYVGVGAHSGPPYESRPGNDGGPIPVWGYAGFVPAVPVDATRLEAVNGADRFVIALAGE